MDFNPLLVDSRLLDAYQTIISSPSSAVTILIDENPEVINFKAWHGLSLLHQMCMRGTDAPVVTLLIERGAEVDSRSQTGETPLHYACRKGCLPIIHILLKHGADKTAVDHSDHGCMHFAAQGNSVMVMFYLKRVHKLPYHVENSAKQTPLHIASLHGNWQAVEFLLRRWTLNPLFGDVKGNLGIHLAAMRGDPIICCQYMNRIGNSMAKFANNNEESALDLAKAGTTTAHRITEKFLKSSRARPFPLFFVNLFSAPVLGCIVPLFFSFHFLEFWRTIQMVYWIIVIIGAGCWISSQQHRLNHPSKWPNPARAGVFLWGIFSNLLVYFEFLYPVTGNDMIITGFSWISIIIVFYSIFSFYCARSNDDKFEQDWKLLENGEKGYGFCDACLQIQIPGVRHCRLCGDCFRNLQHHCLFLMKCVTASNERYFTLILASNLISCVAFITNVIVYLQNGLIERDQNNQLNIMFNIGDHLWMLIVFVADFICVFCSIMLLKLQLTDPYSWPKKHQHQQQSKLV